MGGRLDPLTDQDGCISTKAGGHFTNDLAGDLGVSSAQIHQLIAGAAEGSIALGADLLGDLLASLAAVAGCADLTEVGQLAKVGLHQNSGFEIGATAAVAGGDGIVEAESGESHRSGALMN